MKVKWNPTMHDAFEYASILERLPLVIESIASYGEEIMCKLVLIDLLHVFISWHVPTVQGGLANRA
jgi:hypothetical protein